MQNPLARRAIKRQAASDRADYYGATEAQATPRLRSKPPPPQRSPPRRSPPRPGPATGGSGGGGGPGGVRVGGAWPPLQSPRQGRRPLPGESTYTDPAVARSLKR